MPTYCYQCQDCGHTFEVEHGMYEPGPAECLAQGDHERGTCGGSLKRLLFPVAGWLR